MRKAQTLYTCGQCGGKTYNPNPVPCRACIVRNAFNDRRLRASKARSKQDVRPESLHEGVYEATQTEGTAG
jgi:ribosomal protein L37E